MELFNYRTEDLSDFTDRSFLLQLFGIGQVRLVPHNLDQRLRHLLFAAARLEGPHECFLSAVKFLDHLAHLLKDHLQRLGVLSRHFETAVCVPNLVSLSTLRVEQPHEVLVYK
jgi:hypothetical protein